jgi:hypothetical protein
MEPSYRNLSLPRFASNRHGFELATHQVGRELRLQSVKHLLGLTGRIGRRLQHQGRHCANDGRFCHPAFASHRPALRRDVLAHS